MRIEITDNNQVRRKMFAYRIYPTKQQELVLLNTLNLCCELYNNSLEERKEGYRSQKKTISFNQQSAQLPEVKELKPELKGIHSQILQDVLHRLDKAMQAFFRRVRKGEKPGYPRFKSANRFDSFIYPQSKPNGGFSIEEKHINLSKIGKVKMKLHRTIEGKVKTCTIKREVDHWYVVLTCDVEAAKPLPANNEVVGIDLGVTHFAALSNGEIIDNPRHLRHAEKRLKKREQQLARKKKGSHRC